MKIGIKKEVEVEAKELRIYSKICDGFTASLHDQDGAEIKDYEGYVPHIMPGEHYGDYIILNIDIDTGQITNWVKPSKKEIEEFIELESD
jgi:desulfoferrodoxin (superoxide reductase-like protein)